ncbi:MAG: NTP transferase domain-containing protein [Chloroflexi bacterium]|nr:NTP transferase domain-containing protein [Chloroflexota bacterium]
MKELSAAIMAGGRGERLDVLACGRTKATLPFAGNTRLIDFVLDNCIQSNVQRIAILLQHEAASVSNYLSCRFSGAPEGRSGEIRLCRGIPGTSGEYLGTAHAVYMNLPYLLEEDPEAVLVLASDHVYSMDYRKMLDFHREQEAAVTVGLVEVPPAQASRFGIVDLDRQGRIRSFEEKPQQPRSSLASMSVYIFSPWVLAQQLARDAQDPSSVHDFGRSILPGLVERQRVCGYLFQGYWRDVGTIQAYWQAHMELLRGEGASRQGAGAPSQGLGERGSSLAYPGCLVEGMVENSVLFPGVRVAKGALVHNSVLLSGAVVEADCIVTNSVVDEGARIGAQCYIGFPQEKASSARASGAEGRGITVLGRDSFVPRGTAVGCGCIIEPHVAPGDLASAAVPPGTRVIARQREPQLVEAAS